MRVHRLPEEKIMNLQRKAALFVAIALICGHSSFAQQIKFDYDRSVDFSHYKTYSWGQVQTQNPLWVARIKDAVDASLAAKGWTEVDTGGSVSIMAMEINKNHRTLDTYYDGFGGGWRWGGGFGDVTTTESTYRVGTLVLDLFDSENKDLLWRGSASDTLSDNSDRNIRNLDKAVHKLFEHFPPNGKER
jgi:hypothetical protein